MADPRFFRAAGPFTVAEIARATGSVVAGACDADLRLEDVAPLDAASSHHLSFLSNRRYVETFAASRAGAALVHPEFADRAPAGMTLLLSAMPYQAFAKASVCFYPGEAAPVSISPAAVVDPTATLGRAVSIGHHAVIGAGVEIADHAVIGPNTVIGDGVAIGEGCRIGANVTVSHCIMGARVTLYPGVRIGQDGFGFAPDSSGHVKLPQLGRVIIGDDVEIGANTTIDRGAGPDTVIGAGTMIDNLVQIGHNVVIGRNCVIVAQTGISGSTTLGDFVFTAGQAGLAGHLKIGNGARIAAKTGVMRDVAPAATVAGIPAVPVRQWHKQTAIVDRLAKRRNE